MTWLDYDYDHSLWLLTNRHLDLDWTNDTINYVTYD